MDESGYQRYQKFFHEDCYRIKEWNDEQTDAKGWLAINSLTGGAAGGGTRMKLGATCDDAVLLAKTMEIKFRVSGPPIGGAKSVLSFDPTSPQKSEVLKRWFRFIGDELRSVYGTGGDQNVNEDEVIALTEESLGLGHPQEGIVRGHYAPDDTALQKILGQLRQGVQLPVRLPDVDLVLAQSEVITGYGVAAALEALYEHRGSSLAGKRVLVEGFGDVGGPAAYYLQAKGAHIVGIICLVSAPMPVFRWWVNPQGLDVQDLFFRRKGADLPPGGEEGPDPTAFWQTAADIFVPAATSYTIDLRRIEQLRSAGVGVIACGANTPFADRQRGAVDVQRAADQVFTIIPDFIANCGMARTFAYLMEPGVDITEAAIKADVDRTIRSAMIALLEGDSGDTGLLNRAFSMYVPGDKGAAK